MTVSWTVILWYDNSNITKSKSVKQVWILLLHFGDIVGAFNTGEDVSDRVSSQTIEPLNFIKVWVLTKEKYDILHSTEKKLGLSYITQNLGSNFESYCRC